MEKKWLLVTGDIGNGFMFYGPFDDAEEADEFASDNVDDSIPWTIVELRSPK